MVTYELLDKIDETTVSEMNDLLAQLTTDPDVMSVDRMQEILRAGTKILVARNDGRIVGTASVLIMRQMRSYKAWLEDIVVDKEFRGQGIAKKLMAMAADVARDAGCKHINMTSKPGRENAMRLYESLGYKHRETNVYRLML